MITKENIYKKVFENKAQRLKDKQMQRSIMLKSAYASNERLAEIDEKFSQIGATLAVTALSGDLKKLEELQGLSNALTAEKSAILKKAQVPEIVYECDICCDKQWKPRLPTMASHQL